MCKSLTLAGQRAAVKAVCPCGHDGSLKNMCGGRAPKGYRVPPDLGRPARDRCSAGKIVGQELGQPWGLQGDCFSGDSQTSATAGPNCRTWPSCRVQAGVQRVIWFAQSYTGRHCGLWGISPGGMYMGKLHLSGGASPLKSSCPTALQSHSSGASLGPGHSRAGSRGLSGEG